MLSDDNVIDFFLHGDDKFRWQDESTMRFIKGSQRVDVFIYLFIYLFWLPTTIKMINNHYVYDVKYTTYT